MSFTRRHYKAIADAIGKSPGFEGVIDGLCELFRWGNPRFDEGRFRQAIEEAAREAGW